MERYLTPLTKTLSTKELNIPVQTNSPHGPLLL